MDSRLISNKLLSVLSNPLPLLGVGVKDRFKLASFMVLALFTLPFLLLGDSNYTRATAIVNKAAPKGIMIKTEYGRFYCRNYDDFFVLWPSFEAELSGLFTCDSSHVFIDVGAHAGRYTVMVGNHAKRVVAIEPNSENFKVLKRNIALNGLCNVDALNYACWDTTGLKLKLFLSSSPGKHSFLRPQTSFETVDTVTLDQILENLKMQPSEVGLVKIDAEGAELPILKGGARLFGTGRPRLIFEAFSHSISVTTETLRSYGYDKITQIGEINYVAEKIEQQPV